MSATDANFKWVATGSTVTSGSQAFNIFNTYGGLSLLRASEVVHIQICASGGDFRLSANHAVGATNNTGLFIGVGASFVDLPPMQVSDASQISFARESANNPTIQWVVWRRIP